MSSQLPSGEYRCILIVAKRPAPDKLNVLDFVLADNGERGRAVLPEFTTKRGRDAWSAVTAAGMIGAMSGSNRIWLPRDQAADQQVVLLSLKFDPKYPLNTVQWGRRTGEALPCDIRFVSNYVEPEDF